MIERTASGQEIYDFLMKDSGNCFDDDGSIIPGDCNLWYLGCNEKFGELTYNDMTLTWHFGKASFANVMQFVTAIFKDGGFTLEQYETLLLKIEEGLQFKEMCQIREYLLFKQKEQEWKPKEAAGECT